MSKFTEAEIKGREIWKTKLNQNKQILQYYFPQFEYTQCDCFWDSNKNGYILSYVGEIKKRDHKSNKYPDSMIEYKKYQSLKLLQQCGFIPYYIVVYDDCIYLFNLTNVNNPDVSKKWCPKTTCGEVKEWEEKEVFYLDFNYGTKIKY